MTAAPSPTGGDETEAEIRKILYAWIDSGAAPASVATFGAIKPLFDALVAREDALRAEVEGLRTLWQQMVSERDQWASRADSAESLAAERAAELNARDRLIALLRTDIQKGLGQVDPTICDGCGAPIYADENQAGGDVRGCWGYVAEGGPPSPCYRYRTETGADRSWPPCAALAASGGGDDA